jgi:hypothetical protein
MKSLEDEFRSPPPDWIAHEQQKKLGWSFKSENMSELLARPAPVISWLIESLWVDKARGLIAGNPGVGKTWLALEMLLSVSTGLPCLNKYAVKAGATLLVEEESSPDNLARRVHCMAHGRGLDTSDLVDFHHITRQFLKIPKHEKELIAFIKHHSIKLVVFDSLRRFHGVDENSSEKMQPILDSFGRINIEAETSVVLIHHLSKQPNDKGVRKPVFERMRGTSDLWAWRDCIIGMEGEPEATSASCSFQFRDAESPAPISIKRIVDEASGSTTLEMVNIEESEDFADKSEALLTYVRDHQPVSKDQACTKCKGKKQTNGRIFDILAERSLLVKNGYKWVVPKYMGTNGNDGND